MKPMRFACRFCDLDSPQFAGMPRASAAIAATVLVFKRLAEEGGSVQKTAVSIGEECCAPCRATLVSMLDDMLAGAKAELEANRAGAN